MRIKTYNQNKELISEKEINCNVPKYIQEFDDSHPLVTISNKDYKLLNSKFESAEKTLLIEKFRYILRYDYSTYLDSDKGCDISFRLSEGLSVQNIELRIPCTIENRISNQDDWLIGLIDHIKDVADEKKWNPIQIAIWLDYIKSESKDSWATFYNNSVKDLKNRKNRDLEELDNLEEIEIRGNAKRYQTLLNIVRNEVYPILKGKKYEQYSRLQSALRLIPSRYSSYLQPYSFDDDKFIIKLCNALYETKSKRRSDLYGIVLTYNYMSEAIVNSSLEYIRRIDSPEYVFVFDDKNGSIRITLAEEEYTSMQIGFHNTENIINIIKEILQKRYDDYWPKEHLYIEQQINNHIYNEFGVTLQSGNVKRWKDFYRITRNKFEEGSKISERSNSSYYYNLLFATNDNPYNDFEISQKFTKDLLFVYNKLHGIRLNEVFDNIYCLNYIKQHLRCDVKFDDPFTVYPDGIESNTMDELFNRIMDFLTPILKDNTFVESKWINGDHQHNFRLKFRKLLELKSDDSSEHTHFLRETLIKNIPYKNEKRPGFTQGFNIKLLCNIIGALTSEKEKTQRIFREHTADRIINRLCNQRNIPGSGSYRNYISRYYKFNTSESLLNKERVKYIQNTFNVTPSFN